MVGEGIATVEHSVSLRKNPALKTFPIPLQLSGACVGTTTHPKPRPYPVCTITSHSLIINESRADDWHISVSNAPSLITFPIVLEGGAERQWRGLIAPGRCD